MVKGIIDASDHMESCLVINLTMAASNCYLPKKLISNIKPSKLARIKVPEMKTVEFANSVDSDEVAHCEPPHLEHHCLPSLFEFPTHCSFDEVFLKMGHIMPWPLSVLPSVQISLTPLKTVFEIWIKCLPYQNKKCYSM